MRMPTHQLVDQTGSDIVDRPGALLRLLADPGVEGHLRAGRRPAHHAGRRGRRRRWPPAPRRSLRSETGRARQCVCSASQGQPPGDRSWSMTATTSRSREPGRSYEPWTTSNSMASPRSARRRDRWRQRLSQCRVAVVTDQPHHGPRSAASRRTSANPSLALRRLRRDVESASSSARQQRVTGAGERTVSVVEHAPCRAGQQAW